MKSIFSLCSGLLLLCLLQVSVFAQNNENSTKKEELLETIDRMIADTMYNLAMSEVIGYKQRETEKKGFPNPDAEPAPDPLRIYGEQGDLIETGRSLDIAVQGAGFIRVLDSDSGEMVYTRYGSLEVDFEGNLCVITGNVVRLLEPSVSIPEWASRIEIKEDGEVWAIDKNSDGQIVGQLQLTTFMGVSRLKPLDEFIFRETPFSGPPTDNTPGLDGAGVIKNGFLEKSNVDVDKMQRQLKRLNLIRKSLQTSKK